MNEILLALAGLITLGGSAFFGWFFARRKFTAEATTVEVGNKALEIDNEIKQFNYHKELLDDLKPRYESRYKEFEDAMNRKIVLLEEEIKMRDRKIRLLQAEITELKKENRLLKENASSSIT